MTPAPKPPPPHPPRVVALYGFAGLLPFLLPPLAAFALPAIAAPAAVLAAAYAAVILSFLGGARWAFEVARPEPRHRVIALAMLPSLAAFALLLLPPPWRSLQLAGLALLLALHLAWDLRSAGLPAWYPRLRIPLSVGAVVGLLAGAVIAPAG